MKRQIIKTRPQRPYIVARVILGLTLAAAAVFIVYEIALHGGLHFH